MKYMKYLNLKWIYYEMRGWIFVGVMNILMKVSDKLMNQEGRKLLKTKFGDLFIKVYETQISKLTDYIVYGNESGLQEISNSCFWNK